MYKHWTFATLSLILFCSLLCGVLNYFVDPYQFYRKAEKRPYFVSNPYYRNPGIARNYDYDTIIIGNSFSENFVPSHANRILGVKAVKLTIGGSSIREQCRTAEVAIRTGKVREIILGLSLYDLTSSQVGYFPEYLYDVMFLNDYKYLLNSDVSKLSLRILGERLKLVKVPHHDIDLLGNWDADFRYGREVVLNGYPNLKSGKSRTPSVEVILKKNEPYRNSFDRHLVALIQENPSVQFHIFYPPHSILYFTVDIPSEEYLKLKEYTFRRLLPYQNVRLFDFQDIAAVTFNLDHYKDSHHYSQKINDYILECMARGEHLVTRENHLERLGNLRKQIRQFDPGRI